MRISFSVTPLGSFIVTAIQSNRVVYAEEHDGTETLLEVVNRIRYDMGLGAIKINLHKEG